MRKSLILGAALAGACLTLLTPAAASAHPLGNFSINQYAGVEFYPDRVDVRVIVDYAELPTLQARSTVDVSGAEGCAAVAPDLVVNVGGTPLRWTVGSASFGYRPGAAGLETSVLTCGFTAPARLDRPAEIRVDNAFLADRVGWRELTAVGHGVTLAAGAPPSRSITDELRAYPQDLLTSPLDVRSVQFRTTPGGGTVSGNADNTNSSRVATSGSGAEGLWGGEAWLRSVVGADGITPVVGVLAVVLALLLGAGHAALPGHGKTVMAVYLAGKAGRARDALAVGLTVTATHTGGVLIVGLLLTTTASLTGESVLGWLGVASGVLVVVVGGGMLFGALRHRHQHRHGHHHEHGHHEHGHDHHHHRWGLAGMGIAGGLVPSPSALVVLLGAVGLGRTGFGVLLVLAYGVGMAIMLTVAGLVLLRLRQRWADRRWMSRLSGTHPSVTAGLVIALGCGLIGRAAGLLG